MTGYIRTDTANNIADGNIINAADFDNEYNAIEAAFNASTGHVHDGTAANGAPITKVGPAQDVVVSTTTVLPKTTNTLDLGSSLLKFKDAYVDGTGYIDTISTTTFNGTTATKLVVDDASQTLTNKTIAYANNTLTGVQPTLVSGTSIKTVNSTSLLGSGDVAVQPTLVSGTNIKTINSGNILGSGDLVIKGGIEYIKKTANYTAVTKDGIIADTGAGTFTVELPSSPAIGDQVFIVDGNNFGTTNLTVGRNGSTIEGLSEDLILDIQGVSVQFIYSGSTWDVYAQVGGTGGTVVTETGTQTLTNKTMDYNSNTFLNFPPPTPFSNNTSLAQVQATALSF